MSIEGKATLVTGASRGIGRALAVGFAAQGALVVAAARTERPGQSKMDGSLEETVSLISEAGGKFTDWTGAQRIDGGNAVGTNGKLHAEVLEMLGDRS